MINKALAHISLTDIRSLVSNSVPEGTTLDYKETYSLATDREKGEFLADISSFANTLGGDLVFGISDEKGSAKELTAFATDNIDEEKQKIENLVRDGISPRIAIDVRFLEVETNRFVLVIRVSKSWAAPNRVVFTGHGKTKDQFYARNSAGKYPLDVIELRNAFTLSDTLGTKITDFHARRIAEIAAENTPIPLHKGGKFILHIIPPAAFSLPTDVDISGVVKTPSRLRPVSSYGWNHRINLEGFVTFSGGREERSHSYTQLYRTGIIEAVEALMLMDEKEEEKKYIPSRAYEEELLRSLSDYLRLLKELEINPPLLIFLTISGPKGFEMGVDRARFWDRYYKIDRDILSLPEYLLQNVDESAEDILRPMFDLVWNACGYSRSYNFDENGRWIGK